MKKPPPHKTLPNEVAKPPGSKARAKGLGEGRAAPTLSPIPPGRKRGRGGGAGRSLGSVPPMHTSENWQRHF